MAAWTWAVAALLAGPLAATRHPAPAPAPAPLIRHTKDLSIWIDEDQVPSSRSLLLGIYTVFCID